MNIREVQGVTFIDGGVCAAKGFRANGVQCGLRHNALTETAAPDNQANGNEPEKKKNDLALIVADNDCSTAAVYTTNKVKGAPIIVTKRHLKDGKARAVIVNSVNANTCNPDGLEKADMMCRLTADTLGIDENDVVVASTGVIGQILPIEPIANAMDSLAEGLAYDGNKRALEAIMTTDTREKEVAVCFEMGGKSVTLGGMLKGSGMIHPNMATTLTFLTTDAAISSEMMQKALDDIIRFTLNRVSVDGDTSTNDMVFIMASGAAGNTPVTAEGADYAKFSHALYAVLMNLARMMARDGEGATKLIECAVRGANNNADAENIAKSVIGSSLIKAMIFGEDANAGRIFCALGYADADFDIGMVEVKLASGGNVIELGRNGNVLEFSEMLAKQILREEEISILISVGDGEGRAIAWGCDLTYDYVRINGDYRS